MRWRMLSLWLGLLPACVLAQATDARLPVAVQPQAELAQRYMAALQRAITLNWMRPDSEPAGACLVHIVQLPGGQVVSATVDPSCPYDTAGQRSVVTAVLRAQPLPYQGYESLFRRRIDFTFRSL